MGNVVGVKWSANDQKFALTMYRRYADALNFIDNDMPAALSLPAKLGATGFVNSDWLVAPRFVLREWELFRERRYDELDDLLLTTYVDPFLGLAEPEDVVWQSMGEGPHARAGMETSGWRWVRHFRRSSRCPRIPCAASATVTAPRESSTGWTGVKNSGRGTGRRFVSR